jgi:predicted enzyme related to lactoylglutathione lyase
MAASLRFYEEVLGFKRADWVSEKGKFASVSRDGCGIYLSQGGQGQPGTWVWIGVDGVDELFEEIRSNGAKIVQEPTNYSWAWEMRLEDPDGHILRFGGEPNRVGGFLAVPASHTTGHTQRIRRFRSVVQQQIVLGEVNQAFGFEPTVG